ncbi:MAG TPA: DUF3667 domain-containing protein [Flavobacterium sp.]|jgi:hypothetical protein
MEKLCLNCRNLVNHQFCPHCGQKTDSHRITFKHFITHDLLHGVWHLERGIFYTIKEAVVRPEQAALDYIQGKRIRYYNVFYLCLLLIGINARLVHYIRLCRPPESINSSDNTLFRFLSENAKFLVFAIVPVLAANATIIFRRFRLNFAEHLIIGGFCLIGIILSSIFWYIFDFGGEALNSGAIGIFELVFILILLLYPFWTYLNLTKNVYSTLGRAYRVLLFYLILLLELVILLLVITYLVTGTNRIYMSL